MKKTTMLMGLALMTMSYEAFTADVLYRAANDYTSISLPMKLETTTSSPTGARVYTTTASSGSVKYQLELDTASEFQVEAYVLSDSTSRNTFGVSVADGAFENWDLAVQPGYEWQKLPTVFDRQAGVFEITLNGVDAYTRIAAVRISKIPTVPLAVSFSAPTVLNEGEASQLTFTKTAGKSGVITYKVLRGRSYTEILKGNVTFTAADTMKTIDFTIPDDQIYDEVEDRIKIQVTGNESIFVPYNDNDVPVPVTDLLYHSANEYVSLVAPMKIEATSSSPTGQRLFTTLANSGSVKYNFDLSGDAQVKVEAYVLAESATKNAIALAMNGSAVSTWDLDVSSAYTWRTFSTAYAGKRGSNELIVSGVDAYTRIAAIRIVRDDGVVVTPPPLAVTLGSLVSVQEGVASLLTLNKVAGTAAGTINYQILNNATKVLLASGSVAFLEGETSKTISVLFPEDTIVDSTVSLEVVVGNLAPVIIPVVDNDVSVPAFAVTLGSLSSVNEGVAANLAVNKVAGTAAGNIAYQVLNNETKAIISSGTLVFAANDTAKSISVLAPEDSVYTANMKLEIKVGAFSPILVSVVDNESPPVVATGLRVVSEPTSAFFGKKLINLSVEMVDANGNRVTDSSAVVTAQLKDAGILSGSKSATMVNGVATFNNLTVVNGSLSNKLDFKSGTKSVESDLIDFQDFSVIDSDADITSTINATSLANAVTLAKTAAPGTRILVPNETITNTSQLAAKEAHYNISANGLAGQPVIIEPLNAGGVVLKGTSKVKLSGKYLVLKGIKMLNVDPMAGYGGDLSLIRIESCDHCAVRNIKIEGGPLFNAPDAEDTKHFKSILIAPTATYAEISHSDFVGKKNAGSVILINRDAASTAVNGHRIYRNQFLDRVIGNNGLNDFDIIRIGDSKASLSPDKPVLDAAAADVSNGTTIENNLFENYNLQQSDFNTCAAAGWNGDFCGSEPEVISVKSPQNILRFNTFRNINGGLTLRHGFQNIVEGNYFFGGNVVGSYGVRVIGDTQVVMSNHIQDIRPQSGAKFKGALVLVSAYPEGRKNSDYWPVYDTVLAFNFMAANSRNIFMSANYNASSAPIVPVRNLAAYNFVSALSSSSEKIVKDAGGATSASADGQLKFEDSSFDIGTLGWPVASGWTQTSGTLQLNVVDQLKMPLASSSQGVYEDLKVSEAKLADIKTKQGALSGTTAIQKTRLGRLIDKVQIRNGNLYDSIPPLSRGDVGSN